MEKEFEVPKADSQLSSPMTTESLDRGILIFDREARLLSANLRAQELLGLPLGDASRGKPYAEIVPWPESPDTDTADQAVLSGDTGREETGVLNWTIHEWPDGRAVLWSRTSLPNLGFAIVIAPAGREHERALERRLYERLSQRIASAETFESAARAILRTLCRHGGWQYGEAWVPEKGGLWLEFGQSWAATADLAKLLDPRLGGRPALRPGEGLAGRIWQAQRVEVIPDLAVATDRAYSRRRQALSAGLPVVLGVPLKIEGEVVAICVFNTGVLTARAQRMLDLVADLAPQLRALMRVKVANDAASNDRQRLAELFAAAGDAIIMTDGGQIVTGFNREAERLWGYSADEVIGKPLDILLPKTSAERHRALVDAFGRGKEKRRFMGGRPAVRGLRKDGTEFIAEASITKAEIAGGLTFTAVLRDVTELKQAELRLRSSEKRFRDVAEIASDLIWELDSDLRFTYMSAEGPGQHGGRERSVLGKTPWEVTRADTATHQLWARCRADLEAHRPFRNFEYSVKSRDGRTQYFRVSGLPIFDENGAFTGYRGITTDETATMSALVRAQEAEELLRSAIESISEGFAIYDKEDRLILCNQAYHNYSEGAKYMVPGIAFEAMLRTGLAEGLYVEAIGREEEWLKARMHHHREATGLLEQTLRNGRHVMIAERRMPNGATAGLRMDVTALKRAEAALRESQRLLQTTFETISEGIVVFDHGLRIASLNQHLFGLLGIESSALEPGDSAEKLVRLCYSASTVAGDALEHCIEQELAMLRQFCPKLAERSFRNGTVLEIRDSPLAGGGVVRTYRDISIQKRIENELRAAAYHAQKASEAKSEFMASMSHELRTPLNAIIGFSEMMRDGMFGPLGNERYQAYARDIHQSGRHLLSIINDILEFAKLEAGRRPLVEEEVDVVALVRESMATVRLQAEQEGIELSIEPANSTACLFADATKVRQILMNLVSNAVKFTPSGGRVTVSYAADPEAGFSLSVKDTGIGMAAEEIPIALEPFRQLDGRLNRKYPGTGLGLPLTKRLVELHGGTFAIESTPGEGTVVTVTLPPQRILASGEGQSDPEAPTQLELNIEEILRRSHV